MSRPREPIDPRRESPALLLRFRKEKPGWERERLLALKRVMEGEATQRVADELGRSQATIQSWINKFRSQGIEGLLNKGKGIGPSSRLTPEMQQSMSAQLELGKWRTARDAWKWLQENHDVGDLKESVIYKYLGKCEGRLKATRPCNPQKDPEAEKEFRVTLADKMQALNIPAGKVVRLWVYDEMRYGLHPLTRKMGCRRGIRATAPSKRRFENGYLYGALEVGGSGTQFLFTPELNKQWDQSFLKQLSDSDSEAIHLVIGDGAGFHHQSADKALPENLRILTLPAYCPELNPTEKLWDIVKDGICNQWWEDLQALQKAITRRIRPYWEEAKRVKSLIGEGYLLSELNVIPGNDFRSFNC